jgi:AbiV family abortive infection protein
MTISLGIQMPASVTAQYLLEGAAYALEQCGLLLADANLLYRGGSNASTVVLAAFAREELGKYKILLKLRKEVLNGKHLTEKYVKTYCRDHEQKQKEGMASISLKDPLVGTLIRTTTRAPRPAAKNGKRQTIKLRNYAARKPSVSPKTGTSGAYLHFTLNPWVSAGGKGLHK